MATEAQENLILDALLVRCQAIAGGPTYNTNPGAKAIGIPADAAGVASGEAIYVQHARTEFLEGKSGPSRDYQATFHIWCIGDTDREVLNMTKDVRDAIHADHAAITAVAKLGWVDAATILPGPEAIREIGRSVRIVEFLATFQYAG